MCSRLLKNENCLSQMRDTSYYYEIFVHIDFYYIIVDRYIISKHKSLKLKQYIITSKINYV